MYKYAYLVGIIIIVGLILRYGDESVDLLKSFFGGTMDLVTALQMR